MAESGWARVGTPGGEPHSRASPSGETEKLRPGLGRAQPEAPLELRATKEVECGRVCSPMVERPREDSAW